MSAKPNQLVVDALLAIESEVEGHGWDQPATLWVVVAKDRYGGVLEPLWVPAPVGNLANDPRPYMGIYVLLEQGLPFPPNTHAVVFVSEGWRVTGKGSQQDLDALLEQARARTISQRADKLEVRFVQGLDRRGRPYMVERVKGESPVVWGGLDQDPDHVEGDCLDALRALGAVVWRKTPT